MSINLLTSILTGISTIINVMCPQPTPNLGITIKSFGRNELKCARLFQYIPFLFYLLSNLMIS